MASSPSSPDVVEFATLVGIDINSRSRDRDRPTVPRALPAANRGFIEGPEVIDAARALLAESEASAVNRAVDAELMSSAAPGGFLRRVR